MREQLRPWFRSREDFDSSSIQSPPRQICSIWASIWSEVPICRENCRGRIVKRGKRLQRGEGHARPHSRPLGRGARGGRRLALVPRSRRAAGSRFQRENRPNPVRHPHFARNGGQIDGAGTARRRQPLGKAGQAVSASGVPAGAALGVPQAQDRGSLGATPQVPPARKEHQSALPLSPSDIMSDADPEPVRPGAKYAMMDPSERNNPRPGRVVGEGGGGGGDSFGVIAGVQFRGSAAQLKELQAARKAGAEKAEIQEMVDRFKGIRHLQLLRRLRDPIILWLAS